MVHESSRDPSSKLEVVQSRGVRGYASGRIRAGIGGKRRRTKLRETRKLETKDKKLETRDRDGNKPEGALDLVSSFLCRTL